MAKRTWWPSENDKGRRIRKAIVWDETMYEGNISMSWGSLSPQVQAQRFWTAAANGAHCAGHSNTALLPENNHNCSTPTGQPWDDGTNGEPLCNPIMWWNKGGTLRGESPPRIQFYREVMSQADVPSYDEMTSEVLWEVTKPEHGKHRGAGVYHLHSLDQRWHLVYWLNTTQPVKIPLLNETGFAATHIDYWNMTQNALPTVKTGKDSSIDVAPPVENYVLRMIKA